MRGLVSSIPALFFIWFEEDWEGGRRGGWEEERGREYMLIVRSFFLGVCSCLDDEELNYLGAPFDEYAKNAKLVGLDVIRSVLRFRFRRRERNEQRVPT